MKNIGRYNGIPCVECSRAEYRTIRLNELDNQEFIYVIGSVGNIANDRPMVQNNKIIGYYDGHRVRDVYQNEDYIKNEEVERYILKTKVEETKTPYKEAVKQAPLPHGDHNRQVSSTPGYYEVELKVPEINFSDYSQIVDNFFKHLK